MSKPTDIHDITPTPYEELLPGQHFMVATEGMRGHFACEMWINPGEDYMRGDEPCNTGPFPEPWCSDDSTYATKEEARRWARRLAIELDLPYCE